MGKVIAASKSSPIEPVSKIITDSNPQAPSLQEPKIVVFGSLAIDLACDHTPLSSTSSVSASDSKSMSTVSGPLMNTSNTARITQTIGGVGHNVALAAHLASGNLNVRLCSFVGEDL